MWTKLCDNDKIFISYRREYSAAALVLYNELLKHYSKDNVFIDKHSIQPGANFRMSIDDALTNSTVLLVVIGNNWSENKQGEKLLDNPDDYVRLEISTALEKELKIIPILIDDSSMPHEKTLPETIKLFAHLQAFRIAENHLKEDVRQLVRLIKRDQKSRRKCFIFIFTSIFLALILLVGPIWFLKTAPISPKQQLVDIKKNIEG